MKKITTLCLGALLSGFFSQHSMAEIAVIVAPSVNVNAVTAEELQRFYLGKSSRTGVLKGLVPLDQKKGSGLRQEFSSKVLGKTERELSSYWSRLMFSGKGHPPRQLGSDKDVIEEVTGTAGKLGYIDASSVDENTKVILRIP